MKKTFVAALLWTGALCLVAPVEGAPKIQFERTVYDFGTTSQVAAVSGVFKFKNAGDGVLRVQPPRPSCGCTVAELTPDVLKPGETGELAFTLNLGQGKAQFDKRIAVTSNDPQTPEVSLTIRADYTPLYEINPIMLSPNLAFGEDETVQFATLSRTDGKPLHIVRLDVSKPWITAEVQQNARTNVATARIRVTLHRNGPPRRFNEFVHIYAAGQTNTPVAGLSLNGQVMGEVSMSPEAFYWSVPVATNSPTDHPEALALQRVTIRSSGGKTIELRNPQSTIKGIKVELLPKEAGKVYELIARLDAVPASTVSGNVSFETSLASQSRIEVPVIVNVSKP